MFAYYNSFNNFIFGFIKGFQLEMLQRYFQYVLNFKNKKNQFKNLALF